MFKRTFFPVKKWTKSKCMTSTEHTWESIAKPLQFSGQLDISYHCQPGGIGMQIGNHFHDNANAYGIHHRYPNVLSALSLAVRLGKNR